MPKLKTPVTAALFSGLLAATLCLIFDLNQLIDMMSIGTLMAYSVVAVCVLILRFTVNNFLLPSNHKQFINNIFQHRYRPSEISISELELAVKLTNESNGNGNGGKIKTVNGSNCFMTAVLGFSEEPVMRRLFAPSSKKCTKQTSRIVNVFAILSVFHVFMMSLLLKLMNDSHDFYWYIAPFAAFFFMATVNSVIISRQPQDHTIDSFKVFIFFFSQ
jgi:amino acid transporter